MHRQFWYMTYWLVLRCNGIKTTEYCKISNEIFDIKYLVGFIPLEPNCQYSFFHSEIATVVFMSVYLMCLYGFVPIPVRACVRACVLVLAVY